jgi:hypothetical protein
MIFTALKKICKNLLHSYCLFFICYNRLSLDQNRQDTEITTAVGGDDEEPPQSSYYDSEEEEDVEVLII